MLYFLKTSLNSLWKDIWFVTYNFLLWLGTEHVVYDYIVDIYSLEIPIQDVMYNVVWHIIVKDITY